MDNVDLLSLYLINSVQSNTGISWSIDVYVHGMFVGDAVA